MLLSDNDVQLCADLSQPVYKLVGIHELTTSSVHSNINGGTELVNYMAQVLFTAIDELPERLGPSSPSGSIRLQLCQRCYWPCVYLRFYCSPLTIFERVTPHQSFHQDQLAYCDLARDLQTKSYNLVRKRNAMNLSYSASKLCVYDS